MTPTVADVVAAHHRLRRFLPPTPVAYSRHWDALLKLDNLQVTGAFKVRGALNALACQMERGDSRPVVAASAGNHAQGVAWAAAHFGLHATLVVPQTAPQTKIEGCRRLGAEIIVHGDCFEDALAYAQNLAGCRGLRFLHPFDDPEVIAGQGTLAMELLPLRPDVVIVPIGGGGLAAGVGLVLSAHGIRVVGVRVNGTSIADGLMVKQQGRLAKQICAGLFAQSLTVTDLQVRRAVAALLQTEGIIAEGAGAAAIAALPSVTGKRKLAVISGGNIDKKVLAKLVSPC